MVLKFSLRRRRMKQIEKRHSQSDVLDLRKRFLCKLLSDLQVELNLKDPDFSRFCELIAMDRHFNLFQGIRLDDVSPYLAKLAAEGVEVVCIEMKPKLGFKIKRLGKERNFPFSLGELSAEDLTYRVKVYRGCPFQKKLICDEVLSYYYDGWFPSMHQQQHFYTDEELEDFEY